MQRNIGNLLLKGSDAIVPSIIRVVGPDLNSLGRGTECYGIIVQVQCSTRRLSLRTWGGNGREGQLVDMLGASHCDGISHGRAIAIDVTVAATTRLGNRDEGKDGRLSMNDVDIYAARRRMGISAHCALLQPRGV